MRPASPGGIKVKFHDKGPGDRLSEDTPGAGAASCELICASLYNLA